MYAWHSIILRVDSCRGTSKRFQKHLAIAVVAMSLPGDGTPDYIAFPCVFPRLVPSWPSGILVWAGMIDLWIYWHDDLSYHAAVTTSDIWVGSLIVFSPLRATDSAIHANAALLQRFAVDHCLDSKETGAQDSGRKEATRIPTQWCRVHAPSTPWQRDGLWLCWHVRQFWFHCRNTMGGNTNCSKGFHKKLTLSERKHVYGWKYKHGRFEARDATNLTH